MTSVNGVPDNTLTTCRPLSFKIHATVILVLPTETLSRPRLPGFPRPPHGRSQSIMNDARKESFAQLGRRKSGSKFDPGREPKSQMPVFLEECCGAASLAPMSRPAGPQLGRSQRKAPAASFEGIGSPSIRRKVARGD